MSQEQVDAVGAFARERGWTVAAAESLTSGRLMSALGAGQSASEWLAGGVVAYREPVKFDLLGVTPGPVITARCARELAEGVGRLLDARIAVGITGCGGPDPEEDQPPGTVYVAVRVDGELTETHRVLEPDAPTEVLEQATELAVGLLAEAVAAHG